MLTEGPNDALVNKKPFRLAILVGTILFIISTVMTVVGESYEDGCKNFHLNFCDERYYNHHLCEEEDELYCCNINNWRSWEEHHCSDLSGCFEVEDDRYNPDCTLEKVLENLSLFVYVLSIMCFLFLIYYFRMHHKYNVDENS